MSDPISVSRTLPSGAQIGTLNSNLEDISEAYDGKVRSINDIQPSIVGKVLLDTGVLTINNTQPTDGNIDITNPADIGEHPTKIIFSDEETHGVKYQNNILYFENSSGDVYEVETEPVEYAGHVVITADDVSAASGVGVTLSQGTEVRNGTFNSSGVCTIDTTNYGDFTLSVSTFSITQTVSVLPGATTNVSVHIAKANITITPVGDILYNKTVTLSDGQTGTFGSGGEAVAFVVYSTGIYSATCEGYSTGSIGVNALDQNYSASIYGTASLTLSIEGAKGDVITIKNADNETITTVSFDDTATSKSVTLTGIPYSDLGNDNRKYTFISGVAKDTTTGTTDYSKNITLTNNLSEVKVMPDKYVYWYGNFADFMQNFVELFYTPYPQSNPYRVLTLNKNSIYQAIYNHGENFLCSSVPVTITGISKFCVIASMTNTNEGYSEIVWIGSNNSTPYSSGYELFTHTQYSKPGFSRRLIKFNTNVSSIENKYLQFAPAGSSGWWQYPNTTSTTEAVWFE